MTSPEPVPPANAETAQALRRPLASKVARAREARARIGSGTTPPAGRRRKSRIDARPAE